MSDSGYEWPSEMSDADYEKRFGTMNLSYLVLVVAVGAA